MKVLVVCPEFPPCVIGGGGAVYQKVAGFLTSRGHDVTVAHGDFSNASWFSRSGKAYDEGLPYRRVPLRLCYTPRRLAWMLSTFPPTWSAFRRLGELCAEPWDVVHLHGIGFPLIDLASAMLRRRKVPYVLSAHGVPAALEQRTWLTRKVVNAYIRLCTMRTIQGAAGVTAVSRRVLNHEVFRRASHRTVIHNGIDDVIRTPPPASEKSRLRLLMVARLDENKGVGTTIKAIELATKRGIAASLDIYGADGGGEERFRRMAASLPAVTFKGTFEPDERSRILARYDAMIVASRDEPFGLVALEAFAAGLPLISTATGGLSEVVKDDCALIVEPDDPAAIASAISLLQSTSIRDRLARRGVGRAMEFRWDVMLPKYERILASSCGEESDNAKSA